MTTETVNYWTHLGRDGGPDPHQWRYLGKIAQSYHCVVCQLRVTKGELKEATDA